MEGRTPPRAQADPRQGGGSALGRLAPLLPRLVWHGSPGDCASGPAQKWRRWSAAFVVDALSDDFEKNMSPEIFLNTQNNLRINPGAIIKASQFGISAEEFTSTSKSLQGGSFPKKARCFRLPSTFRPLCGQS